MNAGPFAAFLGAGVLAGVLYLVQPELVRAIISGKDVVVEARAALDGGAVLIDCRSITAEASGISVDEAASRQLLALVTGT